MRRLAWVIPMVALASACGGGATGGDDGGDATSGTEAGAPDAAVDDAAGDDSAVGQDATAPDDAAPAEDAVSPPEDTVPPPADAVAPPDDVPAPPDDVPAPPDDAPQPVDAFTPPDDTVTPPDDVPTPPDDGSVAMDASTPPDVLDVPDVTSPPDVLDVPTAPDVLDVLDVTTPPDAPPPADSGPAMDAGTLPDAPTGPVVLPLYGSAPNWTSYVKNDGTGPLDASGSPCAGNELSGYDGCFHAGELRQVTLAGRSDCVGITADDALGAFAWACDASTSPPRVVSTGFKPGKGLSDLIDATTGRWRSNAVTVRGALGTLFTTASTAWWDNPVQLAAAGTTLTAPYAVYVFPADTTGSFAVGADHVSALVAPGAALTASGAAALTATGRKYLWIEGAFRGAGAASSTTAVYLSNVGFSVLRRVDARAAGTGIYLEESGGDRLEELHVESNGCVGFSAFGVGTQYTTIDVLDARDNDLAMRGGSECTDLRFELTADVRVQHVTSADTHSSVILEEASNAAFTDLSSSNTYSAIRLHNADGNSFDNVSAYGGALSTFYLDNANGNTVTRAHVAATGVGFWLNLSGRNTFRDVLVTDTGTGFQFWGTSPGNTVADTVVSNVDLGVETQSASHHTTLVGLTVINPGTAGIDLLEAADSIVVDATVLNAAASGGTLGDSLRLHGLSASSTPTRAVVVMNAALANALNDGLAITNSSDNTLANVASANNGHNGVSLSSASNNRFTGLLRVGNDAGGDCSVGLGTSPGLTSACAPSGSSDAAVRTGITLGASFVGKLAVDEPSNPADALGAAAFETLDTLDDWTAFARRFRGWGLDGAAFPDASNRGMCYGTGAACRVWDAALRAAAGPIRGALAPNTSGDAVITHTWSDGTSTTFLRNAAEIMGDGVGNENGLCESDERCLYTPNLGAYQGHGALGAVTGFTDGAVRGVTLLRYANNGW